MSQPNDLDIMEMPFEGLAAYWLSIKKLAVGKKGRAIIDTEISETVEPYIKYLLEVVFSPLSIERVRRVAEAKQQTLLDVYHRKFDLMRVALFAIASRENPRITLVRFDAKFPFPPLTEKRAFAMATGLFDAIRERGADLGTLLGVDHKSATDHLLVRLLFYVMYARREGKSELEKFLPYIKSRYFADGLSCAVDNFESDFLAHHLEEYRDQNLRQTQRKMEMSLEMALAIRENVAYDDIYTIARAYIV